MTENAKQERDILEFNLGRKLLLEQSYERELEDLLFHIQFWGQIENAKEGE